MYNTSRQFAAVAWDEKINNDGLWHHWACAFPMADCSCGAPDPELEWEREWEGFFKALAIFAGSARPLAGSVPEVLEAGEADSFEDIPF